jgi:hypothetical protein
MPQIFELGRCLRHHWSDFLRRDKAGPRGRDKLADIGTSCMSYRIACFLNFACRSMPNEFGCALAARRAFGSVHIAL